MIEPDMISRAVHIIRPACLLGYSPISPIFSMTRTWAAGRARGVRHQLLTSFSPPLRLAEAGFPRVSHCSARDAEAAALVLLPLGPIKCYMKHDRVGHLARHL